MVKKVLLGILLLCFFTETVVAENEQTPQIQTNTNTTQTKGNQQQQSTENKTPKTVTERKIEAAEVSVKRSNEKLAELNKQKDNLTKEAATLQSKIEKLDKERGVLVEGNETEQQIKQERIDMVNKDIERNRKLLEENQKNITTAIGEAQTTNAQAYLATGKQEYKKNYDIYRQQSDQTFQNKISKQQANITEELKTSQQTISRLENKTNLTKQEQNSLQGAYRGQARALSEQQSLNAAKQASLKEQEKVLTKAGDTAGAAKLREERKKLATESKQANGGIKKANTQANKIHAAVCKESQSCLETPDFMFEVGSFAPGGSFGKTGQGKNFLQRINWFLGNIIQKLVLAIGVVAVFVMTIGGGYMIINSGQDDLVNKGKGMFTAGIYAVAIALSSYLIIALVRYLIYSINT